LAIYPIIHKKTGEKKVIEMSVHEITQWYEDNSEWKRDWSEGCATPAEAGEWRDKLVKNHPGWNDILQKSANSAGSKSQIGKI
jgi:hypothetical protein